MKKITLIIFSLLAIPTYFALAQVKSTDSTILQVTSTSPRVIFTGTQQQLLMKEQSLEQEISSLTSQLNDLKSNAAVAVN